jgi:hypothetical protein
MGWYIEIKAKDNDKRTYKKQAKYNELLKLNLCISKMNLFMSNTAVIALPPHFLDLNRERHNAP